MFSHVRSHDDLHLSDDPVGDTTVKQIEHTPGPWIVVHQTATTFDFDVMSPNERGGVCVARCGRSVDVATSVAANARLISAAPDMLEALKELVDSLILNPIPPNQTNAARQIRLHEASLRAMAAIRKTEQAGWIPQ